MAEKTRIFLSYTPEDFIKVQELYQKLAGQGFQPWMDELDIYAGENRKMNIQNAIRHSDFFLACLSTKSVNKRGKFQKEFKEAIEIWKEKLNNDIYLIPVRLDDCEIPENLRETQCVDLFVNDGFAELIKGVKKGMERHKINKQHNDVHKSSSEQKHMQPSCKIIRCEKCQTELELDFSKFKKKVTKGRCPCCKHVFKIYLPAFSNEAQQSIEENMWIFACEESDMSIRYFIEIKDQEGQYHRRTHQDNLNKRCVLQLSAEDRINIKGESIPLRDIVQALNNVDSQWLQNWFDERGQYDVGMHLYKQLFGTLKSEDIHKDKEVEIRIITEDEHIARLPWMLLAHKVFLSATGWSVTLSSANPMKDCELPPCPKMLIIAPQPDDIASTNAQSHIEDLQELLSSAISYNRGKKLDIVTTWDDFKESLRNFQPHIIYYYGHGVGDIYRSRLAFATKNNRLSNMPILDMIPLFKMMPNPPMIAYINCCSGNSGCFLGAGLQLRNVIPVVVTNYTVLKIRAAQAQGLSFWSNVLLKEKAPHTAISHIRSHMGEFGLNVSDTRWMTPVLHCHYSRWKANPPQRLSRLERDPHWRVKLDRVSQFSKVFFQVYEMFQQRKPRAFAYLWYGKEDQGIELFHQRLKVDLQEKLINVIIYEVLPEWPPTLDDPYICFRNMLIQAFEVQSIDQIPARIRTYTQSLSGRQTLVYIRHRPITSAYTFHPNYLKTYLEWWNLNFVSKLPERTHALLGISYEVKNPQKFLDLLVRKEHLDELELSDTVFQILDEMEKIKKKDLLDFLKTHNIQLPSDIRDGILEKILKKTGGTYESVLDELKELERRAWRLRKQDEKKSQEKSQEQDEYGDVF